MIVMFEDKVDLKMNLYFYSYMIFLIVEMFYSAFYKTFDN